MMHDDELGDRVEGFIGIGCVAVVAIPIIIMAVLAYMSMMN